MGLWMLQVVLAVGWPIFSNEFLKDKKDCDLESENAESQNVIWRTRNFS